MQLKEKHCTIVMRRVNFNVTKHNLLIIWEKTDRFYLNLNAETFLNAIKCLLRKKYISLKFVR